MFREEIAVPDAFGRALEKLWIRDGILPEESGALGVSVAASFAIGREKAASELLASSGVRARWNEVLRRDRAHALAARIRPLVTEPLLDVLSGDGSVCSALADLGVASLTATERCGDYPESVLPQQVSFRPFPEDFDLTPFDASTALLSTVLHHEVDPLRMLNALARTSIPRWIIVENCVTSDFSRAFHEFADRFFNNCLNEFGVHCGDQHRTLDQWVQLLITYGSVAIVDEAFNVPGIPFPYSILVVSRDELQTQRSA